MDSVRMNRTLDADTPLDQETTPAANDLGVFAEADALLVSRVGGESWSGLEPGRSSLWDSAMLNGLGR